MGILLPAGGFCVHAAAGRPRSCWCAPLPLIRLRSGDGVVEHERAVVASGGCAGLPPGLSGESLCPGRPPTPAAVTAAEHLCCQCAIRVAAWSSDAVGSSRAPSVPLPQCPSPTVYRTSRPI